MTSTPPDPITSYPGETPCVLGQAYELAEQHGLTMNTLAHELTHYMTDGDAIFMPNGGNDGAHSADPGEWCRCATRGEYDEHSV